MTRLGPGDMAAKGGTMRAVQVDDDIVITNEQLSEFDAEVRESLLKLRAPFPPERIEKLPKPKWKGAWNDLRGGHCNECHGYHVLEHCIHLDYVGHANVTDRLLEVDPFWNWEPLATDDDGFPKLDRMGGLWIELTVCGVTRKGYGDAVGKSMSTSAMKEIIGDAIRNAAMRFGVGLDLWAKIDLHEEKNAGDGPKPSRNEGRPASGGRGGDSGAPQRSANQDALDDLGSVCDENGIPRRGIKQQFLNWAAKNNRPEGDILVALDADIRAFTLHLIESLDPPAGPGDGGTEGDVPGAVGDGEPGAEGEGAADGAAPEPVGGDAHADQVADAPAVAGDGAVRGGADVDDGTRKSGEIF